MVDLLDYFIISMYPTPLDTRVQHFNSFISNQYLLLLYIVKKNLLGDILIILYVLTTLARCASHLSTPTIMLAAPSAVMTRA